MGSASKKLELMEQTDQKLKFPQPYDYANMNEFQAEVLLKEQNALAIYRDCIQLRDSLKEDL